MSASTFSFENGVNGNSVTTAAGEASATQLNLVAGTAPKYDTTHIAHGGLAAKFTASGRIGWNITPSGTFYGRLYIYLPANPSINSAIVNFGSNGVNVATSGALRSGLVNGSVAATLNQYVRVEYQVVVDASVGQVVSRLYNSPDSTTISDTVTSAANLNTSGITSTEAARITDSNWFTGSWVDQVVTNATNWPGPFPVSTIAPTVSGSTPVGSSLTCDGGTWNSGATFTLTYQWTRDGSNIGSATSSSYTTVSADSGHAIGCTVTATGVQATNESASQASSNTITATSSSSSSSGADPSKTASAITVLGL